MVDYGWPGVKYEKIVQFNFLFGILYRSRGSKEPSGRVQNRSRSLKTIKYTDFSKKKKNTLKNWFDPINGDGFLRWFSLCPLKFLIPAKIDFYNFFPKIIKIAKRTKTPIAQYVFLYLDMKNWGQIICSLSDGACPVTKHYSCSGSGISFGWLGPRGPEIINFRSFLSVFPGGAIFFHILSFFKTKMQIIKLYEQIYKK